MSSSEPNNKRPRCPPRSIHEVENYHITQLSRCCLSCSINHLACKYTSNEQQCDECLLRGNICQLATASWVRAKPRSTVGQRRPCVHCAHKGQECAYDGDKWDYTTCCSYCKRNSLHCWPLISFRGMRPQTPRLFSGVDINFIKSNGKIMPLLTAALFEAIGFFTASYDFPKNFNSFISTMRDARCRMNFGDKVCEKMVNGKVYHVLSSYGSGSGATSVGTTVK